MPATAKVVKMASTRGGRRSEPPRISIVIPARNEARNLEILLPQIPAVHQVILVDGHSHDDTVEVAARVMPGITIISQGRRGKGNALAHGFAAATGDIIVMLDADGSADPAEIPRFVATLLDGADFAKGTRFAPEGGSDDITRVRAAGNAWLNYLANRLFKTTFTDLCYGYNAFWVDVVPSLALPPLEHRSDRRDGMLWGDGFEIETLINCRVSAAGYEIREVPSVEKRRVFGASNLHAISDGLRVLRTLWAEYRRARTVTMLIPARKHARQISYAPVEQAV